MISEIASGSGIGLEKGIVLHVSDLSVSYRGTAVLDRISFSLPAGRILSIVGPNGAGKTTLFRALMGFIPHSGTIRWKEGIRMGYVPQSLISSDFPISVEEFLRFKCKSDLKDCLEIVGLDNSILKVGLGALSGGQLQRVLLAWSVVDHPDVLLFDEPTSGIDVGAEEPIYERVRKLKEELGTTVLIITHNLHVVQHYSDTVLGLNRRQLYYGDTGILGHSELVGLMMGEVSDPGSHGTHVSSKERENIGV